jgi:hypothetical protein
MQMQASGTYSWSITLPNHWYKVSIAAGDPSYTDSYHKIDVNGVTAVNFVPTNTYKYGAATIYTNVTNGTLVVKPATGSINAKIAFIHITPVAGDQTSVNEIDSKDIKAFISSGNLIIQSDIKSRGQLEIYNTTGQLLLSKSTLNFPESISVTRLHKGIYVLRIKSGNSILQSKIVV